MAFEKIGVRLPHVILPKKEVDLQRWAVVACDQYTSQPEYWEKVGAYVNGKPSTLALTLPEVYLEAENVDERVERIHRSMEDYLAGDIFRSCEDLIYVERTVGAHMRRGLMLALDLDNYDFHAGSQSLIRASEFTIEERIPPRLKVRDQAALETPHIMILIDDPQGTVIGPLASRRDALSPLYDFDLMMDSGHLRGFAVKDDRLVAGVADALTRLADTQEFYRKYRVPQEKGVLLFAVGDGNHSMATAKTYWEKIKAHVPADHPARFALVEVVNLYDEALAFEPIHRLLFGLKEDAHTLLKATFGDTYSVRPCRDHSEMIALVKGERNADGVQRAGLVTEGRAEILEFAHPTANLSVTTVQAFVDEMLEKRKIEKVDYVHGDDVLYDLGNKPGNLGLFVPVIQKEELFRTVILDGNLPRKAFSMGHAQEKRFYLECRKIRP